MKRGLLGGTLFALLPLLVLLAGFFDAPSVPDRTSSFADTEIGFGDSAPFSLEQPFGAACQEIEGVMLAVGNPAGRRYMVELLSQNGLLLARTERSNPVQSLEKIVFAPIAGARRLRLTVEDGGPRIEFYGGRYNGEERMVINGAEAPVHLYLTPMCRYGTGEKAHLLLSRVGMEKPGLFGSWGVVLLTALFETALFAAGYFLFTLGRARRS